MNELKTPILIISLVILGIIGWFLYAVSDILLPFILAMVLAYILSPVVRYLQLTGMKRVYAVSLLFAAIVAIAAGTVYLLAPKLVSEARHLKENAPQYSASIKAAVSELQRSVEEKYPVVRERRYFDTALAKAQAFLQGEMTKVPSYLVSLFSVFSLLVLIPVLTFFILLGGKDVAESIFSVIPSRYIETSLSIFWEIDEVLGKFIRGQLIESTCVGVLSTAGLLVLGVDYALLIGMTAGFANMVPYLGPMAGAVPAVLIALIKFQQAAIVMKIIVMFMIVQFIDNQIIQPIIMSQGVELNPAVIIFAVMAGAQVYGFIGMLLAVPVAAIINTTIGVIVRHHTGRAVPDTVEGTAAATDA